METSPFVPPANHERAVPPSGNPVAASGAAGATQRIVSSLLLVAAWLSAPAHVAHATPVIYSFTTGDQPFQPSGTPIFGIGTSVSGTFTYDTTVAASGTDPNGSTIYAGSITNLVGSVGGNGFSDPSGQTKVGNEVIVSGFSMPVDLLVLSAEPVVAGTTTPEDLKGFTAGGLDLVNVRLFWNETLLGAPDFLTSQDLPSALPTFEGRLSLDFIDPTNPSGPATFVFFDGLFVQAASVPEPTSALLVGGGLALVAMGRAHHRRGTLSS